MSRPQLALGFFLEKLGLVVEGERQIGRYRVDFYLPELKVAVEYDGPRHNFGGMEKKRDEKLRTLGVIEVIHLQRVDRETFDMLRRKLGAEEAAA